MSNIHKQKVPEENDRLGRVISDREAFGPMFEPRTPNRFLVHIKDERTGKVIIPHFLIKYIDRPRYSVHADKKRIWHPLRMRVYESIVPTNIYFNMLRASVFTVTVEELGPVADVVGCWVLPKCRFSSLCPRALDWASDCDPLEVWAEIEWTEVIVKDGDSEFTICR